MVGRVALNHQTENASPGSSPGFPANLLENSRMARRLALNEETEDASPGSSPGSPAKLGSWSNG